MKAIVLLAIVLSLTAKAGNETHGGDLVECAGKPPVVLDHFHATLKQFGETTSQTTEIAGMSRGEVISVFREKLKPYVFATRFEEGLRQVGDLNDWIEADLKDVDDSDEPYHLPPGCERRQGAVRQGNEMYVDPTYVRKLSPAQEGMLVVHEAIYWAATTFAKQKTSVHVRELVRNVLRLDTTEAKMIRAIHALGGIAFPFEALANRLYVCEFENHPRVKFTVISAAEGTLYATLYNSSHVALYGEGATLKCQKNSCRVVKRADNRESWFGTVGRTFTIEAGTRKLNLTGGTSNSYSTSDSSPHFP